MLYVRWATPRPTTAHVSQSSTRWLLPQDPRQPLRPPASQADHPHDGVVAAFWSITQPMAGVVVDTVLGSRALSAVMVPTITLAVAGLCVRYAGLYGLILNLPALAVIWAAAYGMIRVGRNWRGTRTREAAARSGQDPRRLQSRPTEAGQLRAKKWGSAQFRVQLPRRGTGTAPSQAGWRRMGI
jgi:hypothetical protein